jgi:hypothetical protein
MEPPAYEILLLSRGGLSPSDIIKWFSIKYKIKICESGQFVTDILESINQQLQTKKPVKKIVPKKKSNQDIYYSKKYYCINHNILCLYFQTAWFENQVHPLLKHLETEKKPNAEHYHLYKTSSQLILEDKNNIIKNCCLEEFHLLKGKLFMAILNHIYKKEDNNWMAVFHAAAISNGTKAILFRGASGNGKSTLATILQNNNFYTIADDFTPIEATTGHLFELPFSISLKNSAVDVVSNYYPNFNNRPIKKTGEHYISPKLSEKNPNYGVSVKAIIFVSYKRNCNFNMVQISPCEALKSIIKESWLSPLPINVLNLLNWICRTPCFKMEYSNNRLMVENIQKIFNGEL